MIINFNPTTQKPSPSPSRHQRGWREIPFFLSFFSFLLFFLSFLFIMLLSFGCASSRLHQTKQRENGQQKAVAKAAKPKKKKKKTDNDNDKFIFSSYLNNASRIYSASLLTCEKKPLISQTNHQKSKEEKKNSQSAASS